MAYVRDFDELTARGSFNVRVPKWVPLTIEYGYGYNDRQYNWYWRVQGTVQTFRMPYADIMHLTSGNYEKHVQEFLEDFREEYLSWAYGGFTEPWMREYHEQYKNLIEL